MLVDFLLFVQCKLEFDKEYKNYMNKRSKYSRKIKCQLFFGKGKEL